MEKYYNNQFTYLEEDSENMSENEDDIVEITNSFISSTTPDKLNKVVLNKNQHEFVENDIDSSIISNIISNIELYNDDSSINSSENKKKFLEPIIIENINLEKFFLKSDLELAKKNNKKLKITDKGLYSISKYSDASWITKIIVDFLSSYVKINPNDVGIIDGTAGIGGNTISFAKYFNKVYAIEINNTHYDVLKNNINALNILNVDTYLNNFLNIIDTLNEKANIFFFDPPWGGKNYKNFKYFNLKIGKLHLNDVINALYIKKYKYVILKAPYNLNISSLLDNIKYENMNIHKNYKKNMILLIFY
jgi:16S rRNA G966 N2-methylase RsmD